MSVHDRLQELGIELQPPPPPVANYIRSKRSGNLLFVAGQRPAADASGNRPTGRCGAELTVEEAYQVARQLGIRLLGTINHDLGSLDRVTSILKVHGLVNCAEGFSLTTRVIDGCSDLMTEVFGDEIGKHTRAAYCVGLGDAPMEIEMIVEFK